MNHSRGSIHSVVLQERGAEKHVNEIDIYLAHEISL